MCVCLSRLCSVQLCVSNAKHKFLFFCTHSHFTSLHFILYLPLSHPIHPPFQTQLTRTSSSSKLNERLCFYIGQLMLLASICFFIQWNTLRAHLSATPVPTRDAPPLVLFLLGTGMLVLVYVRYFFGFLCYQCRGICIFEFIWCYNRRLFMSGTWLY